MYVKMEVENFWWLENNCWSGALDRLKEIKENGLEDEFMDFLQIMFFYSEEEIPTMTELNDFIWFDCDEWIEKNIEEIEE